MEQSISVINSDYIESLRILIHKYLHQFILFFKYI